MNWKLAVILLTFAVISCAAPVGSLSLLENSDVLPTAESVNTDTVINTNPSMDVNMVVCNSGGLNVRKTANGEHAGWWLRDGQIVTVTGSDTIAEDMSAWTPVLFEGKRGFVNSRFLCDL